MIYNRHKWKTLRDNLIKTKGNLGIETVYQNIQELRREHRAIYMDTN